MDQLEKKSPKLKASVLLSCLEQNIQPLFWSILLYGGLSLVPSALTAYEPTILTLPYEEKGIYLKDHSKAFEYAFTLETGQRLIINLKTPSDLSGRLYEMGGNNRVKTQIPFPLKEEVVAPTDRRSFLLELHTSSDQIPFTLQVQGVPLLLFPVKNQTYKTMQGLIGDQRDEGIRLHEGIDIPAPLNTPLLAVRDGTISDTGTRIRGGNFIILRDSHYPLYYYYAHLNSYSVEKEQKVKGGEILGTIGDTGNAKKGDYHLHFGVYDQRFVFLNPYDYLAENPPPKVLDFETSFIFPLPFSAWIIIKDQRFLLPSEKEGFFLPRHTPLIMVGNSSQGYKVLFNKNVVFLDLHDLVTYVRSKEVPKSK